MNYDNTSDEERASLLDKLFYSREWMDGVSQVQYLQYIKLFTTNLRSILKTYFLKDLISLKHLHACDGNPTERD